MRAELEPFVETSEGGILAGAEIAAAEMVCRQCGIDDRNLALAVALAVWAHRSGHSCLELDGVATLIGDEVARSGREWKVPPLPSRAEFEKALIGSTAVAKLDAKGTGVDALAIDRPLVLLDGRLYSQRQFADELSVSESLAALRATILEPPTDAALELIDAQLAVDDDDDRQNAAAKAVLSQAFTVLTGGPGTGKTYTLTRILLAFLVDAHARGERVSIGVCAPTGKAARRAKELLDGFVNELRDDADVPSAVIDDLSAIVPVTIHRLLQKSRGRSTRFVHDAERKLPYDLVVVDETSMVPLQMMARLLEAIAHGTRLLLVGDDAQLESVESGSVLRDLVSAADRIPGSVHALEKVRRVTEDAPIAAISSLVRAGDGPKALELIRAAAPKVVFTDVADGATPDSSVVDELVTRFSKARRLAHEIGVDAHRGALELVVENRLLCGARRGPLGVETWNDRIEKRLRLFGGEWFRPGRALLVTVNSPRVGLVNGEVGLVVRRRDSIEVAFADSDAPDGVRYVSPIDMPAHDRAFAMTVHKSQGSEYRGQLVLMLPQVNSPLLTRELVYTGITRAAGDLVIVGSETAFLAAVANPSIRVSGLADLLD